MNIDLNQQRKQLVWDFWKSLEMAQAGDIEAVAQRYMHKDALWHGPAPIDDLQGPNAFVSGTGYFNGTFANDYLSIPATGRHVLPLSRGIDGVYPPPQANGGVLLNAQDADESDYTLNHIRRFIFEGLNSYDQSELGSMGMADYFHPNVQWYGPGGIGACLSFKEFEENHQRHWLRAFPDRSVQNLDALIAEGSYSGAPGWAGVKATHTGDYLDCEATGQSLIVNGLDFWKLENDVYVENWVFVDMIHLFRQFGVDLFARIPG